MLEEYIREQRKQQDILLMTHIVLGYPSFGDCMRMVESMVEAGVELMELQIPFSEPMADGSVILQANAAALARGANLDKCLAFAAEVTARFPIPFLFMTYYNIPFVFGLERFAGAMADRKMRGAIVPDLPPEEANDYLAALARHDVEPIFLFSPTTHPARMAYVSSFAKGFVYCVARKGVTGADTAFGDSLDSYLARCRAVTSLPLAVGFGIKDKSDVDFLRGKADVAIVGSETLRIVDREGLAAVGPFIRGLR